MHRCQSILILCLVVALTWIKPVSSAEPQNVPPEGFVALFNGSDVSGWRGMGHFDPRKWSEMSEQERAKKQVSDNEGMRKHWRVEDGELVNDGHGAYCTTIRDYGDFELLVDWKMVDPLADGGIYLRGCPQVQIWDPANPNSAKTGALKGSGGLFNNNPDSEGQLPLVKADRPVGQWNTFRIMVVDDRVSVVFNGQVVVNNVVMHNFWDRDSKLFATGPIQFQTHGGEIRYRNVFIRELDQGMTITWKDNYLNIASKTIPGGSMEVLYLEAYCRPGSTDRDWDKTVIGHRAELVEARPDRKEIKLRDRLDDGVVVDHTITAGKDEVEFLLVAHNPTDKRSEAHWAQPCIRVDKFTGTNRSDARTLIPQYARKCFLFLDGSLTRMPTEPWATKARYTPGQVYCPAHVDRDDINPRPLSELVPSSGLTGCFSADESHIMAVAWEPYQEVFQGVLCCIHNDFRLGGLKPGEIKKIRGKMYFVPANVDALVERFEQDFPEQAR